MEITDITLGKAISHKHSEAVENSLSEFGNSSESLQIGREKINSLKNSIIEINSLIEEREALSKGLSDEVDKIKMGIENFLLTNTASDADGFRERNGLRQKQIEVSELQLNERVTCWKDIALLKKELRELQKELNEKEDRMSMFDKILDNEVKGGNN